MNAIKDNSEMFDPIIDVIPTSDPIKTGSKGPLSISRRDTALFFNNFDKVIELTENYQGTLPAAWEEAQQGLLDGPREDYKYVDISSEEKRTMQEAVRRIKNAGLASVVIEAAHVYMYEDLDNPVLRESIFSQTQKAAVLTQGLKDSGICVRHVLFVDDYNPDPEDGQHHNRLDIPAFIDLTQSAGYRPEMLIKEADMLDLAKSMVGFMGDEQNLTSMASKKTGDDEDSVASENRILLSRRNIELHRLEEDLVSCSMLDAALTVLKFRYLGAGIMNILPRNPQNGQNFSYKNQQSKVREIIREHLNVRVAPYFNLYVGEVTAVGAHNAYRKPDRR